MKSLKSLCVGLKHVWLWCPPVVVSKHLHRALNVTASQNWYPANTQLIRSIHIWHTFFQHTLNNKEQLYILCHITSFIINYLVRLLRLLIIFLEDLISHTLAWHLTINGRSLSVCPDNRLSDQLHTWRVYCWGPTSVQCPAWSCLIVRFSRKLQAAIQEAMQSARFKRALD